MREAHFNLYMDEQQGINAELVHELRAMHVDLALPTRTLRF